MAGNALGPKCILDRFPAKYTWVQVHLYVRSGRGLFCRSGPEPLKNNSRAGTGNNSSRTGAGKIITGREPEKHFPVRAGTENIIPGPAREKSAGPDRKPVVCRACPRMRCALLPAGRFSKPLVSTMTALQRLAPLPRRHAYSSDPDSV